MTDSKLNLDWTAVEKALAEGTFSGYKIGILETEKLFKKLVADKQIPGKNIEIQIKYLENYLSMPEKFQSARETTKKIVGEVNFEVSREDTIKAIGGYWQAMLDVDEAIQYLTPADKIKWQTNSFFAEYAKKGKEIAFLILIILSLFLFFGKTAIGQQIFDFLTLVAYWIIVKIGIWMAIIALVWFIGKSIVRLIRRQPK